MQLNGALVLRDFFGVAPCLRLLQLRVEFAQFALLLQRRRLAVVALELRQFGIEAGAGVARLLCEVSELFLRRVDAGVEVLEGGAVQRGDARVRLVGGLGHVLHGDGAVLRLLVEHLRCPLCRLHGGDVLRCRVLLHLPVTDAATDFAAGIDFVERVIEQVDRLGVEFGRVVELPHRRAGFFDCFARLLAGCRLFFGCRGGGFFGSSGLAFGVGFLLLGVCRVFGCFCAFAGGFIARRCRFAQGVGCLRPALHPGAQDLHLFGGEAGECAGALHLVVQRFEIRCA